MNVGKGPCFAVSASKLHEVLTVTFPVTDVTFHWGAKNIQVILAIGNISVEMKKN